MVIRNEQSGLSAGQLSGKIHCNNLAKEFPNSPVVIDDSRSLTNLARPEFTLSLRQWMPREFADEILQTIEKGEAVILMLEKLNIPISETDRPESTIRLPLWDGIRIFRSIAIGKVISASSHFSGKSNLSIG